MLEWLYLERLLGDHLDPRLVSSIEFLAILLLMMLAMNSLELSGMLSSLGRRIVNRAGSERRLATLLCLLVFLASAFLTNDVVLLGIVPLTITVGVVSRVDVRKLGIFEGIAANAGSLLTPFGNPQNIFISVHYDVPVGDFVLAMAPLWLASLGMLLVLVHFQFGERRLHRLRQKPAHRRCAAAGLLALLLVFLFFGRILPILVIAPAVLCALAASGKMRRIVGMFDWRLYCVFVAMALVTYAALRVYAFELSGLALLLGSVGLSQLVSNVPAAFVLSGAADWRLLALGVNIGGSGTLISSVATVIAYRYVKRYDSKTTAWDFMKWGFIFCAAQLAVTSPLVLLPGA